MGGGAHLGWFGALMLVNEQAVVVISLLIHCGRPDLESQMRLEDLQQAMAILHLSLT